MAEGLSRGRIVELLSKRRDYRREVEKIVAEREFVVFYGCGAILNSIVETWLDRIGRKIDFLCDSDPGKWGLEFSGVKCVSPAELFAMKERCSVFVTVGDFRPVFDFLKKNEVPCVKQIYKYDLDAAAFLASCDVEATAAKMLEVRSFLADAKSREVFDAIAGRVLDPSAGIDVMLKTNEANQYFPPGVMELSPDERFVDVGAFDGDTIRDFVARSGGRFEKIFAFELDSANFERLQANVAKTPGRERIELFNFGAWDEERDMNYSVGLSQSTLGSGQALGHLVTLDKALAGQRVSFVKMDIEGAEPNALRGAAGIIRAQRPKLAICVYHDFRHLWEIPLYVKSLNPGYKLYLRHHTPLEYETVCYAVP
jgi:FkbM family methyltransferase